MNLLNQLLGSQPFEVWFAGMFWAFLGIIAVKLWFLNSKAKFVLKFWINDNLIDVVKGLVWALVILRLGDYVIQLLKDKLDFQIPETTDFVIYMILISAFIQYRLHKHRTPISKAIKNKMHLNNQTK